ncbi:MAG TPA: hypothetical protein VJ837_05560 [Candidatus Paceibacterota bacterium]|nr:hypothetical protein [Candidatus Paceibacterota bacterium]
MSNPILRATDVTGEVYDDPSEDALFMFTEDLEPGGVPFTLQRLEPGHEDESVRVSRDESGLYRFESRQNVIFVSNLRSVHEFLTEWAFKWGPWPADD